MKRMIRFLMIAATLCSVATLSTAQTNLRVDVPFDFQIEGRTLPAGTYAVARVNDGEPNFLALTGVQNGKRAIVHASSSARGAGVGLSFLHNGDAYLLTGISTGAGRYTLRGKSAIRHSAANNSIVEVSAGSR